MQDRGYEFLRIHLLPTFRTYKWLHSGLFVAACNLFLWLEGYILATKRASRSPTSKQGALFTAFPAALTSDHSGRDQAPESTNNLCFAGKSSIVPLRKEKSPKLKTRCGMWAPIQRPDGSSS